VIATLIDSLARAAAADSAHGLIFVDRQERETLVTWRGIQARAAAVAGGLHALGVRTGDTVGVVLPTGPAFFDAFFGVLLAGGVPVPLYPPMRLGRVDEYRARTVAMIDAVRARVILTDTSSCITLGAIAAEARLQPDCLDVSTVRGQDFTSDAQPPDLALVQFSSGTTFEPKPVALSHQAILANVRAMRTIFLQAGEDVVPHGVSWLPLCHDMGLIGCVMLALEHPGSLTLIPPEVFVARPVVWLRALSRTRAMISPAPNFAYALCTDRIRDEEMTGVDLSAWRFALNGAEPVSAATLRKFSARFARWGFREEAMTPVYGLAEATVAVTFSEWRSPFRVARFDRAELADGRVTPAADGIELVSMGKPLPGVEIDVPEDGVGPILVRGPSLMSGYLHQPAATLAALANGWLDTGDVGFVHNGELFVCGRAKDVLILRGRKYAPHDVEHTLAHLPDGSCVAAAAVSHRLEDDEEERLVVFVEAREPAADLSATCCRAILAATGLETRHLVLVLPGQLPRTSSGKVRRAETLRRWLAGTLLSSSPSS
jgi:acyl-CoA synthetase (AMP-forming)/AMP-acid ligase II